MDYSDSMLSCEMRHTRCVMDEQPRTLHCLAPNWVYNARRDCSVGGGLLHLLFTLTTCVAVYFLLHFPCIDVCHRRPVFSNGILLCGVRTFLSDKKYERMSAPQFSRWKVLQNRGVRQEKFFQFSRAIWSSMLILI